MARIGSGPFEPPFHIKLLTHYDAVFRAWGVRAAGNQGKVTGPIRELVFGLANDLWPEVRLQVAIASRKLAEVDPLPLLLDVQRSSSHDPLIARIVWQNLLPQVEDRQAELAKRLEDRTELGLGLSRLIPRTVERLLGSPKADAQVIATLLAASRDDASTVSAFDLILERFRDRSLPPAFEESLRARMKITLDSLNRRPDRLSEIVTIAQVYCGDQGSLKKALEWARLGVPDDPFREREKEKT